MRSASKLERIASLKELRLNLAKAEFHVATGRFERSRMREESAGHEVASRIQNQAETRRNYLDNIANGPFTETQANVHLAVAAETRAQEDIKFAEAAKQAAAVDTKIAAQELSVAQKNFAKKQRNFEKIERLMALHARNELRRSQPL